MRNGRPRREGRGRPKLWPSCDRLAIARLVKVRRVRALIDPGREVAVGAGPGVNRWPGAGRPPGMGPRADASSRPEDGREHQEQGGGARDGFHRTDPPGLRGWRRAEPLAGRPTCPAEPGPREPVARPRASRPPRCSAAGRSTRSASPSATRRPNRPAVRNSSRASSCRVSSPVAESHRIPSSVPTTSIPSAADDASPLRGHIRMPRRPSRRPSRRCGA